MNKFTQRKSQKKRKYTYVPSKSLHDEEIAVYRKLGLTAILVIAFAVSLYLWGIPIIVRIGEAWENFGSSPTPTPEQQEGATLISPRLDPLPSIVRTLDDIVISGTAPAGFDVAIYINDEKQVTVLADASGSFEVKDLKLIEGDNTVYAKTVQKENESDSSNKQLVSYDTTAPEVTLIQPANGTTTDQETIEIIGTTEPQAHVTINGTQAIVNATTGDFNKMYSLTEGSNAIKIETSDRAGNSTTIEITINRENTEKNTDPNTES